MRFKRATGRQGSDGAAQQLGMNERPAGLPDAEASNNPTAHGISQKGAVNSSAGHDWRMLTLV